MSDDDHADIPGLGPRFEILSRGGSAQQESMTTEEAVQIIEDGFDGDVHVKRLLVALRVHPEASAIMGQIDVNGDRVTLLAGLGDRWANILASVVQMKVAEEEAAMREGAADA